MKKLLIISLGLFIFGCNSNTGNDDEHATSEENIEVGSGEEVSPQLETTRDSASMEVDTVSSSTEIDQQQQ
ncbi:hypothetical protein H8S95_11715 [Pontibacter sp. KCTC 32443]|uniref:hypothetical protein n=1 Tax=Pontibacter TaxID=323449 RepID=UPI00164E2BDF|nr:MULTISPECIES: hypothetical protein [Pontibacter]MBC5774732.1 hypothetical protein [Pontibacter sp. KCTC 32443]